jgi:hypothetical protein
MPPALTLYQQLIGAGVSAELHLYADTDHAFNMGQRSERLSDVHWPDRLADWLSDGGWLIRATADRRWACRPRSRVAQPPLVRFRTAAAAVESENWIYLSILRRQRCLPQTFRPDHQSAEVVRPASSGPTSSAPSARLNT